jgi:hypothetical protein
MQTKVADNGTERPSRIVSKIVLDGIAKYLGEFQKLKSPIFAMRIYVQNCETAQASFRTTVYRMSRDKPLKLNMTEY